VREHELADVVGAKRRRARERALRARRRSKTLGASRPPPFRSLRIAHTPNFNESGTAEPLVSRVATAEFPTSVIMRNGLVYATTTAARHRYRGFAIDQDAAIGLVGF
jgi:hypothetical protein